MSDSYLPYKLTDEVLVELIVNSKDPLLFKVLYERYVFKVYTKCLSFSKNNQEAEDLCQDIFVKLLDKINADTIARAVRGLATDRNARRSMDHPA